MSNTVVITDGGETRRNKGNKGLRLTPREIKSLYLMQEPMMEDIVEMSMMLEERERKLALDMIIALMSYKKQALS